MFHDLHIYILHLSTTLTASIVNIKLYNKCVIKYLIILFIKINLYRVYTY